MFLLDSFKPFLVELQKCEGESSPHGLCRHFEANISCIAIAKCPKSLLTRCCFQEFVGFLSTFSRKATRDDQLKFMFAVHDMDGDGVLSKDDLELMLRQLAGSTLS